VGGEGSDTYLFAPGDGSDVILEEDAAGTDIDVLRFAEGVTEADVSFSHLPNGDLIVGLGGNDDRVTLPGWFNGEARIERFELADGGVLDTAFLADLPVAPIQGSDGDDVLLGTGFADHLLGNAGRDTLDGRAGDDRVEGGAGDDVYVLGYDSGHDLVIDAEGDNRIDLERGVHLDDLVRWREGRDLRLAIDGAAEVGVTIQDYFTLAQSWDLLTEDEDLISIDAVPERTGWAVAEDPAAAVEADYLNALEARFTIDHISDGYARSADGGFSKTPVQGLYETYSTVTRTTTFDSATRQQVVDEQRTVSAPSLREIVYASGFSGGGSGFEEQLSSFRLEEIEVTGDYASDRSLSERQSLPSEQISYTETRTASDDDIVGASTSQPVSYVTELTGGHFELSTEVLFQTKTATLRTLGSGSGTMTLERSRDDVVVERIQGDETDNRLSSYARNAVLYGGAGDDQLDVESGWSGPGLGEIGGFLSGGEGSDSLTGSGSRDLLVGGAQSDLLDGDRGNDRYLIDVTQSGIDLIQDLGVIGIHWEEGTWWSAYKEWYYAAQGVDVTEWQVLSGPELPVVPLADPFDAELIEHMIEEGHIDRDWVELSTGVGVQDLSLTWGVQSALRGSGLRPTLNISWGDDRGVRLVMPRLMSAVDESHDLYDRQHFRSNWVQPDWILVERDFGAGIEALVLADGTELSLGDLADMAGPGLFDPDLELAWGMGTDMSDVLTADAAGGSLSGYLGDGSLYGSDAIDVLDGGSGNDRLEGGLGSDLYLYRNGDGADRIFESDARAGEMDIIQLDESLLPDETEVLRSGEDLILRFGSADQQILVEHWFADPRHRIEQVVFDAGRLWSAAEVEARAVWSNNAPVSVGTLPSLVVSSDASLDYSLPSDLFADPDTGDRLTLSAGLADGSALPGWLVFDPTEQRLSGTPSGDSAGSYEMVIRATDQSGASAANPFTLTVSDDAYLTGSDGDELIIGGASNDILEGGAGSDALFGNGGDDLLDGGAGNDDLRGGDGSDAYRFDGGEDLVTDSGGNNDIVRFVGYRWDDLDLSRTRTGLDQDLLGNDLSVRVSATGEELLVRNQFLDSATGALQRIESFEALSDEGDSYVRLSADAVERRLNSPTEGDDNIQLSAEHRYLYASGGNDLVVGSADRDLVLGGAGDDLLYGEAGRDYLAGGDDDDVLVGGADNDRLFGGRGDDRFDGGIGNDSLYDIGGGSDTYVFDAGGGTDRIYDLDITATDTDRLITDYEPLDLTFQRRRGDLRISAVDSADSMDIRSWYRGDRHRIEQIEAGDGSVLLDAQIDPLIQAMAGFVSDQGLGDWREAVESHHDEALALVSSYWQA
jgi:Ca2+-binding RTX toxin-like protein